MTQAQFEARVALNPAAWTVKDDGFIDVMASDKHVARFVPHALTLYYNADGAVPAQSPAPTWPPVCPDCEGHMVVKRARVDGEPFWSCAKWDGPRPRACEGRAPFSLHPDEQAEFEAYRPDNPGLSPEANRAARQSATRRKWQELVLKSLARLDQEEV